MRSGGRSATGQVEGVIVGEGGSVSVGATVGVDDGAGVRVGVGRAEGVEEGAAASVRESGIGDGWGEGDVVGVMVGTGRSGAAGCWASVPGVSAHEVDGSTRVGVAGVRP
jgi:hypothetical protein